MILDATGHLEQSDQLRYVDDELDPAELEIAEQHLAECSTCRDAVDDLEAAADTLTAFLNKTDFEPRLLTFRGAAGSGWWSKPLAIAAAIVLLLGAVAVPFAALRIASPDVAQQRAVAEGEGFVVSPNEKSISAAVPTGEPRDMIFVGEVFSVELTSWQSGGSLTLEFAETDVFSYRNVDGGDNVASINTQLGVIRIHTTADSESNHEVLIPYDLGHRIVVLVGGQRVAQVPVGVAPEDVAVGHSVTINLDIASRGR